MGALNTLDKNFKRTTLAKFGMKKQSLDSMAPDVEEFDLNYPSRNYEFQMAKEKYHQMESQIKKLESLGPKLKQ